MSEDDGIGESPICEDGDGPCAADADPDFELHDIEAYPGVLDGPSHMSTAWEIVKVDFEDVGIPAQIVEVDESDPSVVSS